VGSWNANVVRIALNQDFWLSGAVQYDASYAATVAQAVAWAEAADLDVILDLHWSDKGDLSIAKSGQQEMADVNSKQFWSEVAAAYKGDGHVLFELYNEPHDVTWSIWQNGGNANGYAVVGMQELYDTVRRVGANNVVIAGGLDWAYDLAGVATNALRGYNIMYATHPYDQPDKQPGGWEGNFGFLATGDIAPVVVTEFGDGATQCTGAWDTQLIAFAATHQISWTGVGVVPRWVLLPVADRRLDAHAHGAGRRGAGRARGLSEDGALLRRGRRGRDDGDGCSTRRGA
jgi:endoglucanase